MRNKSAYTLLPKTSSAFFIVTILIVLVVFSEVLTADFVMWDDDIIIYKNPNIGKISLERIYWAFTDVDSMMRYNPLTLLSWCATYHFFGHNPFGYHLVNWLLHGLSSGLLFLIIRKALLLLPVPSQSQTKTLFHRNINLIAMLAALFWAIHPLRVEPVSWATDRTYCQAVFFLLLTTFCYIEAVNSETNNKKRYFFLIISALIFYIFSLLSYAIGTTYFIILLIFDVFLFKRIGKNTGWWRSQGAKKVWLEKMIFANPAIWIIVISVIVRINSAGPWSPAVPLSEFGIIDRLMQAFYITVYYIYKPFYPVDLSPYYTTLISFDPISFPFVASAFVFSLLAVFTFVFRKRWPIGLALLLSHIVLLIPVMGLFEHPHFPVDRYSLVSSICLSMLAAIVLINLKNKNLSISLMTVLIIAVSILGWMTVKQVRVWHNSQSLFTHMIETLGNDPYRQHIYWRLGKYFYKNDKEEKAISNFKKTLEINPYHITANRCMAHIEYQKGNLKKTICHLKKCLVTNPDNSKIHYQLSQLFNEIDNRKKATFHLKKAIHLSR